MEPVAIAKVFRKCSELVVHWNTYKKNIIAVNKNWIKIFYVLKMDDGYGYGGHRAGLHGYDIGPNEDRYYQGTPVDMVSRVRENADGGMEIEYEQVFVARRPSEMFYEPIDETVATHDQAAELRNTIPYATDNRYKSEANRLQTFHDRWLEDYNVKPEDLARDGFIHIGPGDKVKCVFCLKTLRNWEEGDSVEVEHRKHYPFCPFVRGECHGVNTPLNATESMKQSFGLTIKPAGQNTVSIMQDFSHRLQSFENWPKQAPVRPAALAEAGLYYSGTADQVKCFSCERLLGGWEPGDDPWQEHAKFSPHCPHVHSVKGSEYVKQIQNPAMGEKSNLEQVISAGQESNMMQESNEVTYTASAAGATMEGHALEGSKSHFKQQTLSHAIQDTNTGNDQEINSAPVKAILETYDLPVEKMRELLERIKITGDDTFTRDPVKSMLRNYDIPVEAMRQALARVKVTQGGASPLPRRKDLEDG